MEYLVRKCKIDGTQYPAEFDQICEVCLEDSWGFWCQKHSKPAEIFGCEDCAYRFGTRSYFDLKELGEALSQNWRLGLKETAKRKISDWLADAGRDRLLIGNVRETERLDTLPSEDIFDVTIMLLAGDGLLRRRGEVIESGNLLEDVDATVELLKGVLPEVLAEFGILTWLRDLRNHWKAILEELPSSSSSETDAFRLMFDTIAVRDLKTALNVAALVPQFKMPTGWDRKTRPLAEMAARVSDFGFTIPEHADLKVMFGRICRGLRGGELILTSNRDYFMATLLLAWQYEGRTLLENEMFRTALQKHLQINQDPKLLKSLAFGYFRDFSIERNIYVDSLAALLRWYLEAGYGSDFVKWKSIDAQFQVFSGTEAPKFCAQAIELEGGVEKALNAISLQGTNLWGGFSKEILVERVRGAGSYNLARWIDYKFWFEKCAEAFSGREYEWVDEIVGAFRGTIAGGEIRREVSRYLVDRYGEPETDSTMWIGCTDETRQTVSQWLLFENLEKFFDVIADYAETSGGEMRSQWAYRKAFWLAIHQTGAVTDLRIAAGRGLMESLGESRLKNRFGSKLIKLNDSDEKRCALLLKLGSLTIVDFTHNAKCRVWQTGVDQDNWFKGVKLARFKFQGGTDMKIRSHYDTTGIAHFSSETYGWQDAMADFLQSYLPAKLSRSSYEVKG